MTAAPAAGGALWRRLSGRWPIATRRSTRRRLRAALVPTRPGPPSASAVSRSAVPAPRALHRTSWQWLIVAAAGCVAAIGGLSAAGPVGAVLAAGYGGAAARAGCIRLREREAARLRVAAVDAVAALAADLRAGLSPAAALADALPALHHAEPTVVRAAALVTAAWRVSERLGAPLAYLLDRVDAELRAAERCRESVVAQTAGVRATSWLLAALPAAGLALGYAMGGDPLRVLLHTPLGAACATGALLLQCAGLAWTSSLCRGAVEEPG